MDIKTIAAVGDSISNGSCDPQGGWLIRLLQTLNHNNDQLFWSLNNFAISGDTLGDAWHNLCRNCVHRQTDILIIYIGANDIRRKGAADACMCSSPEQREMYWNNIINWSKVMPQQLIICGLLPIDESKGAYICEDGTYYWSNLDAAAYNQDIKNRAQANDIPFIDWYDIFAAEAPLPSLMDDIVHPNAQGHARMASLAFNHIKDWI